MIVWPETENVGLGTVGVGRGVESVVDILRISKWMLCRWLTEWSGYHSPL